jgi:hypothetical protein
MSGSQNIVFFRIAPGPQPNGYNVQAYVATLPAQGSVTALTLGQPINIPSGLGDNQLGGSRAGTPAYDYFSDEIVWPCQGSSSGSLQADVWRLGMHLLLTAVERTPLTSINLQTKLGLILQNQKVTLGGLNVGGGTTPSNGIMLARRAADGTWTKLPFNCTTTDQVSQTALLVRPQTSGMNYVFCLWDEACMGVFGIKTVHLDMLQESQLDVLQQDEIAYQQQQKFNDLQPKKKDNSQDVGNTILWTDFEVELDFEFYAASGFKATIVSDPQSTTHRLYVFLVHRFYHGIKYFYIPLQSDGSLDTYNKTITASASQTIPSPIEDFTFETNINVLQNGQQVMVFWDASQWDAADHCLYGYSAAIGADGSLPNGDGWTNIDITYEKKFTWEGSVNNSFSPVVVPSVYVGLS